MCPKGWFSQIQSHLLSQLLGGSVSVLCSIIHTECHETLMSITLSLLLQQLLCLHIYRYPAVCKLMFFKVSKMLKLKVVST